MEPVDRSRSDLPVDQSRYLRQIITTGSMCTNFTVWNTNHEFQRVNLSIEIAISSSYRDLDRSEVFIRLDFDRRSGRVMKFSTGSISVGDQR